MLSNIKSQSNLTIDTSTVDFILANKDKADEVISFFLRTFLRNGIGALPKTDIDSLVMYILLTYFKHRGRSVDLLSDNQLSFILKTSPTKIRNLRMTAILKYFKDDIELLMKQRFSKFLDRHFSEDHDRYYSKGESDTLILTLQIEDALLMNWLQGKVKEYNLLYSKTLNIDHLVIKSSDFIILLERVYDLSQNKIFSKIRDNVMKDSKKDLILNKYRIFRTNILPVISLIL